MTTDTPILVVGGTGKTGRRVADRLRARGRPVRVGSRSHTPPFDWADPSTWDAPLRGIEAAYVAYYPEMGFPGSADAVSAFGRRAADHGLGRAVLLSGRGKAEAVAAEDAMREALPHVTILRASWFAQNFSEDILLDPVLDGVIALPAGDVSEPFIDVADIADVAVVALTEPGHEGATYELTGPELLTFHDVARELSAATGRTIVYRPVTPEEYTRAAVAQGIPADEVAALTELFTGVLDGRSAYLTDDVERILGRPARSFAAFAAAAAASGVWAERPAALGAAANR